ncbi:MAG: sensor histidine kinase [Phycisphaerales bacterium]
MQPSAPATGSIRDIAVLCAGAIATGATTQFGLPVAVPVLIGIATVGWTAFALSRRGTIVSNAAPAERPPGSASPAQQSDQSRTAPPLHPIPSAPGDLHQAANASDDLLLIFSPEGAIAAANAAASEFFGAGGIGVAGRSIEDLLPQTEIHDLYESARAGQRRECEVAITGRDARRMFRAAGIPLPRSGGDGSPPVLLLLRDVTEFQSALRLGGDFVASVSHELRTPLASIKAALETLEDSVHDDPHMTQKLLSMIDTNVDRLEALTADVLRLSQLESSGHAPDLTEIDVRPALESIGVLLDPLFSERGLSLEIDIAPELSSIRTDPRLFELVFKNLLENAGKFAFENKPIRIVARLGDSPDTSRWSVIDRGIGIPIHHQSRIFDRFYQVDAARTGAPKRRGTGLGLAIVQNAVRALGGTIRVESVWQQGTTMIVELPGSVLITSPSHPNFPEAASS